MASKSEWNNFFLDAKIPKDVAARYAVNFYKNRMSFEMLADLNKVNMYIFRFNTMQGLRKLLKSGGSKPKSGGAKTRYRPKFDYY